MDRESNALEPAHALADELRRLAGKLVEQEIDEADLEAARAEVAALGNRLSGPRRTRWYEEPAEDKAAGSVNGDAFDQLSPLRGRLNVVAPPLDIELAERADGTPCVIGRATLPIRYEGPPRGVHGGIVAALFDEILGASMTFAPPPGVTAKLEVDYHHLTPIDEGLRFEAWISEDRDRRLRGEATCHAGETLTARARALFVRVDFDEVENRMRERRDANTFAE